MMEDCRLEDSLEAGLNNSFSQAIKHGLKFTERESCGLFIYNESFSDFSFLPLENQDIKNKNFFTIDNKIFYSLYNKDRIISLFHTHVDCNEDPSHFDIEISESLGLPSLIYSLQTKEFSLTYPQSYTPKKLFGRIFIPFFQDCLIFYKDYLDLNCNIQLSKDIKCWARKRKNSNDSLISQIEKNFIDLKTKDLNLLKKGDLIVFRPGMTPLMHLAAFHENGYYMHHPIFLLPKKELFTPDIMNKVYKIYRHKDL